MSAVPAEQAGIASGAFNLLRLAGDALGSIVPAAVLLAALREKLPTEIPRTVINELAAGRFAAVHSLAIDDSRIPPIRAAALDGFKDGMLQVVLALGFFALAGILLLLPQLLGSRDRSKAD